MPKGENSPFKPGHQLGIKRKYSRKLAKKPITVRVFEDQYEKLKGLPDLQQRLRELCDLLIDQIEGEGG